MKKQKGFSLIELMIVVAVIGVLSAIALPAYQKYVTKSEAAAGLATLRALQTNVTTFVADNGAFPTGTDAEFIELGAAADMNELGTISFEDADNEDADAVTFTFNAETSINTSTLVMTMAADTGLWSCVNNVADVTLKGCPAPEDTNGGGGNDGGGNDGGGV